MTQPARKHQTIVPLLLLLLLQEDAPCSYGLLQLTALHRSTEPVLPLPM
jgi:hypothetical protein